MGFSYVNTPMITSGVFPLYFSINNTIFIQRTVFSYFAFITLNGSIISIFFWLNPISNRNTIIHKIDALSARFVIVNYALHKLFFNRNNLIYFMVNYFIMLYFFYLSHRFSSTNWCCKKHIICHLSAHLFSIFAFLVTMNDFHNSIVIE